MQKAPFNIRERPKTPSVDVRKALSMALDAEPAKQAPNLLFLLQVYSGIFRVGHLLRQLFEQEPPVSREWMRPSRGLVEEMLGS